MKLTILLLFITVFNSFATQSFSQNTKFTIVRNNTILEKVLKEVEHQSEFRFFYNEKVNVEKKININIRQKDIHELLDKLFQQTDISYEIIGHQIALFHKVTRPSNSFQPQKKATIIKGKITGENNEVLSGVSILVKGTTNGVISDTNGNYTIEIPSDQASSATIVFSYVSYLSQTIPVENRNIININMLPDKKELNEVVVVGFGTQKKQSMVSSISTVSTKELKGPTSNLTTMLSGRIAGIISYQRSGEPGKDDAQFFIRGVGTFGAGKVDPLILIDGIESASRDLARLQPDDISGFSVLKDATASAVYGARGANGVILITTKAGVDGKTKFNMRVENSVSTNTQNFKFADNITYMTLANEAALTRDPLASLTYSQNKIDRTAAGDNPLLYPNNDWISQLIKDYTLNQRYNLNVSGGGKNAQYYVAGTFNVDNGVLKDNSLNGFSSNIKLRNYSVRSNVNLHPTATTEAIVRVYGQFDDYHGPVGGGSAIFNSSIWSNPVMFPAVYPANLMPYTTHPLFGNEILSGSKGLYNNPYAQSVSGYQESNTSTMMAQLELKQNFDFITKGLSARAMTYTQRYAYFDVTRQYNPFFYNAYSPDGKTIELKILNDGGTNSIGTPGTEYLNYNEGGKIVNTSFYMEAAANYNRKFNDVHEVTGMLITTLRNYLTGNAGDLQASLPYRNQGISGRLTYGYDSRYLFEYNFGYNGSERFAKNHRWGFFPSIGCGWIVSNERFFEPLRKTIDNFKLRATYGLVGNDQIGNSWDRFFYMSNVNMNNGGYGSSFGQDFTYWRPGVSISRYANDNIGWEKSKQINLGTDLSMFGALNIIADAFKQTRSNILMSRSYIPSTMGLQAGVSANVGKVESKGIDVSLNYNKAFQNNMWTQIRANFTYAHSKILVYDEPNYPLNEAYRYMVGNTVNQQFGYIAERLFVDDTEVANSPKQNFGEYKGGDIKYRDMNGDGQITSADMVPIGYPSVPEINYGFGYTIGYNGFDFSAFLQGSARSSFQINSQNISPFVLNGGYQNGLLRVIANNHWSEDNRNLYAFWPRLSDKFIDNNNQPSTWWLRNGAFLRLKTVELGYTIPTKVLNRIGLGNARFYLNASNLFAISKFKMWDPEMGGNGLGYPVQRVFNIGLNLGL